MKNAIYLVIVFLFVSCSPHYFETKVFKNIVSNNSDDGGKWRYVDNTYPYYYYELYRADKIIKIRLNAITNNWELIK